MKKSLLPFNNCHVHKYDMSTEEVRRWLTDLIEGNSGRQGGEIRGQQRTLVRELSSARPRASSVLAVVPRVSGSSQVDATKTAGIERRG
jgi:hypothetical protein